MRLETVRFSNMRIGWNYLCGSFKHGPTISRLCHYHRRYGSVIYQ